MGSYFMNQPDSQHDRKEFTFRFFDYNFIFHSDAGVFSKDHIDLGTNTLLSYLSNIELNNYNCLDLGCGYGVVSIVLKRIFPNINIMGVDINQRAIDLANFNANINGYNINFIVNDGLNDLNKFDYIISNPPIRAGKKIIYAWFEKAIDHLNQNGCLIFVMRKEHGLKSALKFCKLKYTSVDIVFKNKGFFVVIAKK